MSNIIQLSEHFYLHEFLRSEVAARMGRQIEADQEIVTNLTRLCAFVLEPIRSALALPITITSGYRPLWLNQRIGGAVHSEHVYGRAADLHIVGMRDYDAAVRIAELLPRLRINQLIFEFDQWIHVSVCTAAEPPRREILTATKHGNRTQYDIGLRKPKP